MECTFRPHAHRNIPIFDLLRKTLVFDYADPFPHVKFGILVDELRSRHDVYECLHNDLKKRVDQHGPQIIFFPLEAKRTCLPVEDVISHFALLK